MGGQQFGAGTVLLDMTSLRRVLRFEPDRGQVEVEAGIQWPELIDYLIRAQRDRWPQWGIIQKQTGADRRASAGRFQPMSTAEGYASNRLSVTSSRSC